MLRIPQGREGKSAQTAIPLTREISTRQMPQMSAGLFNDGISRNMNATEVAENFV